MEIKCYTDDTTFLINYIEKVGCYMKMQKDWLDLLTEEFNQDYFLKLREWVNGEYQKKTVFPPQEDIFNALFYTSYENTKVVILGQVI